MWWIMYEPRTLYQGYLNVEAWVTVEYRSREQELAEQKAAMVKAAAEKKAEEEEAAR